MPTYTFRCETCEKVEELFLRVSELDTNRPACHGPMATVIQPVAGYVQMECRYRCPVTKQGVTSWKQRKEIFAQKGLVDGSDVTADQIIAREQKKHATQKALASQMPHHEALPALPLTV